MYEVLDKDTIKFEILPHLSVAKRGYVSKSDLLQSQPASAKLQNVFKELALWSRKV